MLKSEQEHKSKINEENKALATHGNSTLGGFGGKTKINSIVFFFALCFSAALPFSPLRA